AGSGPGPERGRSMTRWNAGLARKVTRHETRDTTPASRLSCLVSRVSCLLCLAAGLTGCRQQCFMTQADFNQSQNSVSLSPPGLEYDPHAAISPGPANSPPPMTVTDLNPPIPYIS